MLRFILIILIAFAFINQWYVVALLAFLWSLFQFSGFELVVLAVVLDGYYDAFAVAPLLTVGSFTAWSVLLVLRQRLLLYTQENEILS